MPEYIPLTECQSRGEIADLPQDDNCEYMVTWFGALHHSREGHQPLCEVYFHKITDNELVPYEKSLQLPITSLKDVHLGNVYKNRALYKKLNLTRKVFELDFEKKKIPIDGIDYPHQYTHETYSSNNKVVTDFCLQPSSLLKIPSNDASILLAFNLPNGTIVLIPSIEYLLRGYAVSEKIVRIISTYPLSKIRSELNLDKIEVISEKEIDIEIPYWLTNKDARYDASFIANLATKRVTRNSIYHIYSRIQTGKINNKRKNQSRQGIYINTIPWHDELEKLALEGLWIAEDTFFCFKIVGRSMERPIKVNWTRPPSAPALIEDQQLGSESSGNSTTHLTPPEDDIDLGEAGEPQHSATNITLDTEPFEILSPPNTEKVIKAPPQGTREITSHPGDYAEAVGGSTGAAYGTTSRIIPVSFEQKILSPMPTEGALTNLWKAVNEAHKRTPETFKSVGWVHPSHGVISDDSPQLIALTPFTSAEIHKDNELVLLGKKTKKFNKRWLFFDYENRIPRGVLIIYMNIVINNINSHVLLLDVQKRPDSKGDDRQATAVILDPVADPGIIVSTYLDQIRRVSGVPKKLNIRAAQRIHGFSHSPNAAQAFPGECALMNGLKNVGIELPRFM